MKIRKRTIRRYLAMFLVLVLCMGMSLSTLASEVPNVEDVNLNDGETEPKEDPGDLTGQDDSDTPDDADDGDDEDDADDDLAGEPSGDDVTEDDSSDDLDDAEADDSLNEDEDLSEADSTEDDGQTDDDTENEIEEVSEEKEPVINEVEIPDEVRQFRSLLDAMEAFELTQDNQEEYAALGMQASELLEMLLENYYGYPGMEDDMARFQALADKQTGGADTLALISGEKFTVDVVKVVNGVEVDRVPLEPTCLQTTGHSGYNHSTNLRTLANESGFSGYKGYNWSKYTTVPGTYTSGLAPNSNYASVHYNITGSAPYKADETLFLFFEEEKEFKLNYDANGGSGAPAQRIEKSTADKYTFTISDTKPWRDGYTFLGWSTSSTATSPSYYPNGKIAVTGTTTLYAVWEKTQPKEASYTVQWYDTEGNAIKEPETRTGIVGTTVGVTDADKKVDGYIFDADNAGNVESATLSESGTVLRLYFEKEEEKEASYTVEWYDTEGNTI
ncbi:InlB B-repeat-containing protein, partial [Lachnospiraceae bacterium 54-11]